MALGAIRANALATDASAPKSRIEPLASVLALHRRSRNAKIMSEFAEGYSPNTSLRMQALLHTTEVETCLSGASQTEEEAKAALDAVRRPAPFESRRGDDEATKAAHRRERNREHAVASRKRKRERIERLEQENT